ncbi:MAG: gamma-glutamylcyclotransferase [Gammaproteobacteria bacterium]|nr:gamma-glutamylcyclotransferase [Gammaproteobacteria bacterium]MDH5777456.1 gamma-glutamylcyclotransferase [Gammaproteobacteria bacterium]
MTSTLFVYGTLLSGIGHPMNELMQQFASLKGEGYISGRLYDLNEYPGLVLSNNENKKVWGELYEIQNETELFKYLDDYEGCAPHSPDPHEYHRNIVTVHDTSHAGLLAWTYLYTQAVTRLNPIPNGDYLEYRNKGRLRFVN